MIDKLMASVEAEGDLYQIPAVTYQSQFSSIHSSNVATSSW